MAKFVKFKLAGRDSVIAVNVEQVIYVKPWRANETTQIAFAAGTDEKVISTIVEGSVDNVLTAFSMA